jgi:hypothetical protein
MSVKPPLPSPSPSPSPGLPPLPDGPPPAGFASLIVADFPAIFADLYGNRFALLWRGSRDGFRARDFHGRCDGHAPTLTLIEDTDGNIFGGFTPVKWASEEPALDGTNCFRPDPGRQTFIFSLANPSRTPPERFRQKAQPDMPLPGTLWCDSRQGPHFFNAISVCDNCNTTRKSYIADLNTFYRSSSKPWNLLTGSMFFTVKEIEVFEITA